MQNTYYSTFSPHFFLFIFITTRFYLLPHRISFFFFLTVFEPHRISTDNNVSEFGIPLDSSCDEQCCLCCSVAKLCLTHCEPMDYTAPGLPVLHYLPKLLKLMSIESERLSNHLILCHPLLLLPSIFPSISVFSNEQQTHFTYAYPACYYSFAQKHTVAP